jgi:hypothetical protein
VKVTATQGGSTSNGVGLRVLVLTGALAKALQTGATVSVQKSATTSFTNSITPNTTNSRVYGAASHGINGNSATPNGSTTMIDDQHGTTGPEQYDTFKATALSTGGTPVTLGFTFTGTDSGPFVLLEVLPDPAKAGLAEDASAPAFAYAEALTVQTANFTPPPGSLLVALVPSDGGASTTTMTITDDVPGLTWTEIVKNNPAGGDYAGIWMADVPPVYVDAVGGGVTTAGAGPLTWAHVNALAANGIVVGVNYRSGTSPEATAVTYGGVALSRLGTVPSGNVGPGGIDLWGRIGGLPTGSNTVSVTFSGGAGNNTTGGSVSFVGANTFSAVQTYFDAGPVASITKNFLGSIAGNVIVAAACEGNGSAVFATNSPGTQRWSILGDSAGGADNTVGGTWASPGGTQSIGFSYTVGAADEWGMVAVEVQAPTGGPVVTAWPQQYGGRSGNKVKDKPGKRYHHQEEMSSFGLLGDTPIPPAAWAPSMQRTPAQAVRSMYLKRIRPATSLPVPVSDFLPDPSPSPRAARYPRRVRPAQFVAPPVAPPVTAFAPQNDRVTRPVRPPIRRAAQQVPGGQGVVFQPLPAYPDVRRWMLRWRRVPTTAVGAALPNTGGPPPVMPLIAQSRRGWLPKRRTRPHPPAIPLPVIFTNNFEGGTNGVSVSSGNSGGVSGDPFFTVNIVAGGTVAYDNTRSAHGANSVQIATGATSGANWMIWRVAPTTLTRWFREYLYFPANPSGSSAIVLKAEIVGGGGQVCVITVTTGGKLQALDANNASIFVTTASIPLNQWFRIEGFITGDAAAGQVELKLFSSMDSTVPTETQTSAATVNTRTVAGQWDWGTFGANIGPYWIDDIGLSPFGYLGPTGVLSFALQFRRLAPRRLVPRRGNVHQIPGGTGVVFQPIPAFPVVRRSLLRYRRQRYATVAPPPTVNPATLAPRRWALRWVRRKPHTTIIPGPTTTPAGAVFGPFEPTRQRVKWYRRKQNAAVVPSGGISAPVAAFTPPAVRSKRLPLIRRARGAQIPPIESPAPVTPVLRTKRVSTRKRGSAVAIPFTPPEPVTPSPRIRRPPLLRKRGAVAFPPKPPPPPKLPLSVVRRLAQRFWRALQRKRRGTEVPGVSIFFAPPEIIGCTITLNEVRATPSINGYPVTVSFHVGCDHVSLNGYSVSITIEES